MRRYLLVLALLAACHPWYRDGEIAGRRATDHRHSNKLIDDAKAASARGDHAAAEALLRRAIDDVPDQSADTYLLLANEAIAAHDVAGARAAARRGMQLFPSDTRFRDVLVSDRLADDLTADAIDAAGAQTFSEVAANTVLAPHFDALARALKAEKSDTAVGELSLWLAHYGVADHKVLRAARDEVARKIASTAHSSPATASLLRAATRADEELAAGNVARALAFYGDVYRLLPKSELDAHMAGFARAAKQVTDPAAIDAHAYELAVQANADAEKGLLGVAIRQYRKVVARAPWWIDAHRNLAGLFEAAGRSEEAAYEQAFADALAK
jgi:ATP/maltotriose-dependent transcriptional regulator MalT